MSGYAYIRSSVEQFGRGHIFFPSDFSANQSSDTIRSALVRLCEDKIIIRLAQGIYCYPVIDEKWGMGIMYPSLDEVAHAIADKEKCRIAPTGATALNALGMSTQMPANVVYYTDGSPRSISVGEGKGLRFKKTTDMKRFAFKSKLMNLVVMSLKEIGNGKVTESDRETISRHLKKVSEEDFQHDITLAPAWVQKILKELR